MILEGQLAAMRAPACLLALAVAAAAGGEAGCSAGFPVRHATGGAGLHRLSGDGRAAPAMSVLGAHSALRLRGAGDAGNGMQPPPPHITACQVACHGFCGIESRYEQSSPLAPRGH